MVAKARCPLTEVRQECRATIRDKLHANELIAAIEASGQLAADQSARQDQVTMELLDLVTGVEALG